MFTESEQGPPRSLHTMMTQLLGQTRSLAATSWLFAIVAIPTLPAPAAEPLYMPRAVKLAYKHGTRSPDGRPGSKYWQNRARYSISVTTMPPDRSVRGSEQIVYSNNSPDTLKSLVLELLLNIHKPGARCVVASWSRFFRRTLPPA